MKKYEWLNDYLLSFPGAIAEYKAEWEWMRYLVAGKQFAAICTPGNEHKEYANREMVLLKGDPLYSEELRRKHKEIVPGFYSNKQHWNSIFLDGDIEDDLLREMCQASYKLVFKSLTKKMQANIPACLS